MSSAASGITIGKYRGGIFFCVSLVRTISRQRANTFASLPEQRSRGGFGSRCRRNSALTRQSALRIIDAARPRPAISRSRAAVGGAPPSARGGELDSHMMARHPAQGAFTRGDFRLNVSPLSPRIPAATESLRRSRQSGDAAHLRSPW